MGTVGILGLIVDSLSLNSFKTFNRWSLHYWWKLSFFLEGVVCVSEPITVEKGSSISFQKHSGSHDPGLLLFVNTKFSPPMKYVNFLLNFWSTKKNLRICYPTLFVSWIFVYRFGIFFSIIFQWNEVYLFVFIDGQATLVLSEVRKYSNHGLKIWPAISKNLIE